MRNLIGKFFHLVNRVLAKANQFFLAASASFVDEEFFVRQSAAYWDRFPAYEDNEHIQSGWNSWEEAVLDRYFPKTGRFCVVGCSGGRELVALARRGCVGEGIDISARGVERAQAILQDLKLAGSAEVADLRRYDFPHPPYAGVLLTGFTYGYLQQAEDRIAVLARIHPKLDPEGKLLIVYHPTDDRLTRSKLNRWIARLSRLTGRRRPTSVRDIYGPGLQYLHVFDQAEIAGEARAAGWELVHHLEGTPEGSVAIFKPA